VLVQVVVRLVRELEKGGVGQGRETLGREHTDGVGQ
jgi:hypothetical protein